MSAAIRLAVGFAGLPVNFPLKPKFGAACNGCGVCCMLELCAVGRLAFPDTPASCPALKFATDGSRTYCEFVAMEIAAREQAPSLPALIQEGLGIGKGCSMDDEQEQAEPSTLAGEI